MCLLLFYAWYMYTSNISHFNLKNLWQISYFRTINLSSDFWKLEQQQNLVPGSISKLILEIKKTLKALNL